MPTYVRLSEFPDGSASTLTIDPPSDFILRDTPFVVEKFEALCWCDACKYHQKKTFGSDYDMFFCKEDSKKGHEVCEHFHVLQDDLQ